MAKSYSKIVEEIEALKQQAEAARAREVAGVVQRMKEAIRVYSITAKDLGLNGSAAGDHGKAKGIQVAGSPKFADDKGNTWVGRGPRPTWLREALAAGRSLDEFAAPGPEKAVKAVKVGRKKSQKRAPVPAKFKDDAGNTWSGRGSQPRWLVAALADGKKLESMAV